MKTGHSLILVGRGRGMRREQDSQIRTSILTRVRFQFPTDNPVVNEFINRLRKLEFEEDMRERCQLAP
jgi:hypothetical protein